MYSPCQSSFYTLHYVSNYCDLYQNGHQYKMNQRICSTRWLTAHASILWLHPLHQKVTVLTEDNKLAKYDTHVHQRGGWDVYLSRVTYKMHFNKSYRIQVVYTTMLTIFGNTYIVLYTLYGESMMNEAKNLKGYQ